MVINQQDTTASVLYDVFRGMVREFQVARRASGCVEQAYCIGGQPVRICCAGPALIADLTDALAHLAIDSAPGAGITICGWASCTGHMASLSRTAKPGIYVVRNPDLQMTVMQQPASITAYAPRFRLGVAWQATSGSSATYAAPLRHVLSAALRPFGLVGMHAGAVGTIHGAALLAGASGAGKSTTALTCALAGMSYVAEDFCLVSTNPSPTVHSLYATAKLTTQAQAWLSLPALADSGRLSDERHVYLLQRAKQVTLARHLPIRTVLVLRVTGRQESQLGQANRTEALMALAPTSVRLMGMPARSAPAVFRAAAQLVRQVRCYHLELGTNLAALPSIVSAAIEGNSACA